MRGDLLSVVEAAYADTRDPDAWLDGALAAVEPHLNRGAGVVAHRFAHTENGFWTAGVRGKGQPAWLIPFVSRVHQSFRNLAPTFLQAAYPRVPRIAWMTELAGAEAPKHLRAISKRTDVEEAWLSAWVLWSVLARGALEALPDYPLVPGFRDSLGLITGDPSGHECIFFTVDLKSSVTRSARAHMPSKRLVGNCVGSIPTELCLSGKHSSRVAGPLWSTSITTASVSS